MKLALKEQISICTMLVERGYDLKKLSDLEIDISIFPIDVQYDIAKQAIRQGESIEDIKLSGIKMDEFSLKKQSELHALSSKNNIRKDITKILNSGDEIPEQSEKYELGER